MNQKLKKGIAHPVVSEEKSFNWKRWFPLILAIVTFVVYSNSIKNGYNIDDELVTRNHPLTSHGLDSIGKIFTSPYYQDDMGYNYGYRPIVHLSFAIENYFFGEDPQIGHFINVLLYVILILISFRFLVRLLGENQTKIAFIAMLIFAVHPIHTEVVDSLKNRDELLALIFAILSITFLLKQNFYEKKYLWFLLMCIFLICSVLSKKSSIPIFFCAPLLIVNNDKLQTLSYFVLSFIISFLASIFGSDFNIILSLKLFFISSMMSILFFVIKNWRIWKKYIPDSFTIKNSYSFALFICFLLLFVLSIFFKSKEVLIVSYAFLSLFIYLEISKKELISFLIVFSLFVSGLFLKITVLSETASLIAIFVLFDLTKNAKNEKFKMITLVYIIPILIDFNGFIHFDQFIGIFIKIIFLILFLKYEWFKYFILLFVFTMIAVNGRIELDEVLFTLILFFDRIRFFDKIGISFHHIALLGVVVLLAAGNNKNSGKIESISHNTEYKTLKANNDFAEGRELNFVENPLINSNEDQKKLILGFETIGHYTKLQLIPYPLSFYYGYNLINYTSELTINAFIGISLSCILILLVFYYYKKENYTLMFFVFSLILSLSLFSNWFVLVAGILGERLIFVSSFSFILILVYLIYFSKFFSLLLKRILLSLVLFVFLALTYNRNSNWKDPITLMSKDINHLQNSAQANNLFALNLAKFADEQQDENVRRMNFIKAKKHFKRAFTIYSNFPNAYFDYARVSMILGENQDAILGLKKSIQYNPTFNQPYLMLCEYYDMQKDAINMRETANKWIKNTPEELAYIALCKSYILKGDKMTAKKVLIKGQTNYPNGTQIASLIKDFDSVFKD